MKIFKKIYKYLYVHVKNNLSRKGIYELSQRVYLKLLLARHRLLYKFLGYLYGKNLPLDENRVAEFAYLIDQHSSLKPNRSEKKIRSLIHASYKYCHKNNDLPKARALINQAISLDTKNPCAYEVEALICFYDSGYTNSYKEAKFKEIQLRAEHLPFWAYPNKCRIINHEWTYAIGHLGMIERCIRAKRLGFFGDELHCLITTDKFIANKCYLNYLKPFLDIQVVSEEKYWIYSRIYSSSIENISAWKLKDGLKDLNACLERVEEKWQDLVLPPLLRLSEKHLEMGMSVLAKLSLPRGAWFVAIHVRGEGYGFNDLSPVDGRNADISTYIPAIEAITRAGGFVFRMGHPSMKPLPEMVNVIDYAHSEHKSDWMDVFLWASCRFFIGSQSGPTEIPGTFGVPVLATNFAGIGFTSTTRVGLMVPKLWYSNRLRRLLTISETLACKAGWSEARVIEEDELVLIDNSPDELHAAVSEMLSRSESLSANEELASHQSDRLLKQKLEEIFTTFDVEGRVPFSPYFLKKHANLIA